MSASLRDRLSQQIDGWGYDFSQFDIGSFTAWVAARRGRPIEVVPLSLPPELFGAWLASDSADYVFYEDEPLHVHTIHILLHELCHMLLGHKTAHVSGQIAGLTRPGSDSEVSETLLALNGLFRKMSYAAVEEVEAETLSSLIQQRVFQQAGIAALSQASREPAMRQFLQGLGMDQGEQR